MILLFAIGSHLLETEKPDRVCVGNEVRQRASKTSNIVLSGSYTVFAFFFDFSVAFVVRLLKTLVNKRDLRK